MAEPQKTATADKTDAKVTKTAAKTTTPTKETPVSKAPVSKKVNKEEMMQKHQQMVQFVQNMMENMEGEMKRIRLTLSQLAKFDPENPESVEIKENEHTTDGIELKTYSDENAEIVEGKFDGYFMVGANQKKYPVPLNYSSKTKLVP